MTRLGGAQMLHLLGTAGLGMIAAREKGATRRQFVAPEKPTEGPSVIGLLVKRLHGRH
jgi:hypothetical protein